MRSVYFVEIRNIVNSKTILKVAKQFLHSEIYVAGNNKTYLVLGVKYTTFFGLIPTKFVVSRQNFIDVPSTKFHGNTSGGSRAHERTDMTKLIEAIRDYANASKKWKQTNTYVTFG
jgi:RAB protein geranylgeranyltransferase component A